MLIASLELLKVMQSPNMALAVSVPTSAVILALTESEIGREVDTSLFHLPSKGSSVSASRK